MTGDQPPNLPDPLRQEIQTQHPGIADEIEGAIKTLRKLQDIAGPVLPGRAGGSAGSAPSSNKSTDRNIPPPSGGGNANDPLLGKSEPIRGAGREAPELVTGDTFGRYQIVRMLGQGAMGAVYLAYDGQLQRHVALKTPFLGGNPKVVDRFFREARAAAQLRSPYICTVYDVGQISGVHFLSMAFIEGQPLKKLIDEGGLKNRKRNAILIKKIALGIQKAHEQGIIHRDLKPDNIMIDADGEPIVMDFGLAKNLDDDIQLTTPGRILGTPAYMSPEQVEGDATKIGRSTDIYSLGVVFFHLLTGRLPFQGSFTTVLAQIVSQAPPRPSSLTPFPSDDAPLETICLRMMAKSPTGRFPTMSAVAEALDQALPSAGAPAARPSLFRRMVSWWRGLWSSRSRQTEAAQAPAGKAPDHPLPAASQLPRLGQQNWQEKTFAESTEVPVADPANTAEMTVVYSGDVPAYKPNDQSERTFVESMEVPSADDKDRAELPRVDDGSPPLHEDRAENDSN